MRPAWLVLVAACGGRSPSPMPPPPRVTLSTPEWTRRCGVRIELARIALARLDPGFADASLAIDGSPWNPSLRFEARRADGRDGYWQANVEHGRGPCIDFDIDDDSYNNMPWRDGSSASNVQVDRIMRMDGDEAWLQANGVPPATAIAFRREIQLALRECLLDARGVELANAPAGICNFDDVDRCPDQPSEDSDEGCPEVVPTP